MDWKLALGNLISRAPAVPVATGAAAEDALYPFADLGNGHPCDPSRWEWDNGGEYVAEFDLNLLAATSARTDAPSGWADLALKLAGTPGLSANPPEWGTFEGEANSLKLYNAIFQDVEIQPGEDLLFECKLFRPAASDATGVRVVVIDLGTGKQWDGAGNEWNNDPEPLAEQTTDDSWLVVSEPIVNVSTERTTYRVILAPEGGTGASYYVYVKDPALTAEQTFVALVGHNLPEGAVVEWSDGSVTATVTVVSPSAWEEFTASKARAWTLTITMPANTADLTEAPYVGELWAGRLVDAAACPIYPFDILEGDISQVRIEGGLGREDVFTEMVRPSRLFTMKFKTTNQTQYEGARDGFLRACRYGADPVILAPILTVEDAIWHGRVGTETTYSLIGRTKHTFEVKLRESPFPRFR